MFSRLALYVIAAIMLTTGSQVFADVDDGFGWLSNQQQVTGQFTFSDDIASPVQATHESLTAFALADRLNAINQTTAKDFLVQNSFFSTEQLSRLALAEISLTESGENVFDLLLSLNNSDGGYGQFNTTISTTLEAGYALPALALQTPEPEGVEATIEYLLGNQNVDGGWGLEQSSVFTTAIVMRGLSEFVPGNASISSSLNAGRTYLYSQQIEGQLWGSDFESAQAVLALLSVVPVVFEVEPAVNALLTVQQANGSWSDDTYSTALSLQAITEFEQRRDSIQDNTGTVRGRVLIAGSETPIQDATVSLLSAPGYEVQTNAVGQFLMDYVPMGVATLVTNKSGYLGSAISLDVLAGSINDAGDIFLSIDPSLGLISGRVFDDQTQLPLNGSVINLQGPMSVTGLANAAGSFEFSSLISGSYSYEIVAAGYHVANGTVSVPLGSHSQIVQGLIPDGTVLDTNSRPVFAQITDADTQLPIVGAFFELDGVSTDISTSDGQVLIDEVAVGAHMAVISAAGYSQQTLYFELPPGSSGNLGIIQLFPSNGDNQPTTITLQATVVDQVTDAPIPDASVGVIGTTFVATSDQNGEVTFEGITDSAFQIQVSATDYQSQSFDINVNGFGTVAVTLQLNPAVDQTAIESSFIGVVTDTSTQAAITGAEVSIGSENLTDFSGTGGAYNLSPISVLDFTIEISAEGYLPAFIPVNLQSHGDYGFDIELTPQTIERFAVNAVTAPTDSALPKSTVLMSASVENLADELQDAFLIGEIRDASGTLIGSTLPYAVGTEIQTGNFSFAAGEELIATIPWDTAQHAPGTYVFHLNVVEPGSITRAQPRGVLLASGSALFGINGVAELGGSIQPNPPMTQAGAQTPVKLDAILRNIGNAPIPGGEYELSVIDSSHNETVLTRLFVAAELAVNQILVADFGTWVPDVIGQFDLIVQRPDQTDLGSIAGSLLIGDIANADFSVDPSEVPEGDHTVHATVDLTGVDVTTGTSTDPLFELVRQAVTSGGAFAGANAKTWHETHRCQGCHIQTQSLEGMAASINKADIDIETTRFLLNTISTSQQTTGGLHISHPQHAKNQTALGLWALKEWPDQQDVLLTELSALEFLDARKSGSSTSRYWSTDHPTGWLNNIDAMTAIVTQSAAAVVHQVLDENTQTDLKRAQVKSTYPTLQNTSTPRDIEYFDGWLYVGKTGGSIDRMRPDTGEVESFVSGLPELSAISGLDITSDGVVYASGLGTQLHKIFPNGTIESIDLGISDEYSDIKVVESGDVFVVSRNTSRILRISPAGNIQLIASGGLLNQPYGLEILPEGDLIVSSIGGLKLLRVTQGGVVSIYADGFAFPPLKMAWAQDGNLYITTATYGSTSQSTPNGLNVLRPNGTMERIGTFNQSIGIEFIGDRLFIGRWAFNTIQELELTPKSASIVTTFKNSFPAIAQFYLGRFTSNDSETLRIAFRLIGLAEARPFISDTSKLAQIDNAIDFVASRLRSRQRADGGWGRYTYSGLSDPLTTAWIGIALDYTNPSPDDPIIRSTMQFLLNQQQADGSWTNRQGYFSTRLSATSLVMTYLPKALERLGGIDIDLLLKTRPDQAYRNFVPVPDSMVDHGDDTATYAWNLSGVTSNGQQIDFDIDLQSMVLDEQRPAAQQAEMSFANSFTAETVAVAVDIPLITAISEVELDVSTDQLTYQAHEDVAIQSLVSNLKLQFDDGRLDLQVRSIADGTPSVVFDDQMIALLGQNETEAFANQWNTGSQLAGDYEVFGQVIDAQGRVVAKDHAEFTIELTGAAIDSDLKTNQAEYEAWDAVALSSTVLNPSENGVHDATLANLEVNDPNGLNLLSLQFPVAALNTGDIISRGDNLILVDAPAGVYSAILTVLDAAGISQLSQSTATFIVNRTALQSVSGTVVADPHSVFLGDPVSCIDSVSNISAVSPVQVDIIQRLINLETGIVVQESVYAADLGPSQTDDLIRNIDSETLELGGYSCALFAVANGEEKLLSFDQFAVLEPPISIAIEMAQGDHGRILILLDEPGYFVDEEQCLFIEQVSMQLTNHPVAADGAQVTVQLFDELANLLESETLAFSGKAISADAFAGEPNLSVDVTKSGDMTFHLDSVTEVFGSYSVGIEIETDDQLESFDSGPIAFNCVLANQFQRSFGDIRISAMDAQPAVNSDEPFGPNDAGTLNRQRAFLEELLTGAGWNYTIVTSADNFVTEFRTGSYNLYGIFAEKEKLPTDFQGEIREAVYRGEGLVVAGLHDHRDSKIELPLGINTTGKHNDAQSVEIADTEFAPAGSAAILLGESAMRVELTGAQPAARFELSGNPDVADIAVAFFNYGQGRSVFGAVDLLVQAVEAGNGSPYDDLILRGFEFAYDPISATNIGSAVPVKLMLQNEGITTGGLVVLSLPDASELLGSSEPLTLVDGQYIWSFELEEATNIELDLWVSMPVVSGDLVALIQTGELDVFEDYETISITLIPDEGVFVDQVATDLDTLYLADPDTYHIAKQAMDRALTYLTDEDYESALRELMKVTLELDGIDTPEGNAVHLSLAHLVRQVALNLQPAPLP